MDCRSLLCWLMAITFPASWAHGQVVEGRDSSDVLTSDGKQLQEVFVSAYGAGRVKGRGVGNTELISSGELLRAACRNLGESFTTNPAVDVNYADAATGAQQIKLLGLSGTYVQMLTENIPNYRGVAAPFSLGYIPGPWMQSIQVSKGASSVKNGFGVCARAVIETAAVLGMDKSHEIAKMRLVMIVIRHIIQFT